MRTHPAKDCYRTFRSEDIFDRKDQGIMGKKRQSIYYRLQIDLKTLTRVRKRERINRTDRGDTHMHY